MFGSRRHRQRNQPLTAATANPNATSAAASAYARRATSSPFSSAAAAAALRARPTTPINVAEVQTKRTQRRSASLSSHGSQDTRRGLLRSTSQSSMTERTFRSPSPSPHRAPAITVHAPPVPTIPDAMRPTEPKSTQDVKKTRLQMPPFGVASQKKKEGSVSWFGPATEGDLANVRTSDALLRLTPPESRLGAVSPSSSINFSYPRGLQSASPSASPPVESMTMTKDQQQVYPRRTESVNSLSTTSEQPLVYDPNSRRMVPNVALLEREQSVRDASEKPLPKRKKSKKQQQHQGLASSGSPLAKGTVARVLSPTEEAGEPAPRKQEQTQVEAPAVEPEQKVAQNQPSERETPKPVSKPKPDMQQLPRPWEPSPPTTPTSPESDHQLSAISPESVHEQFGGRPEAEPSVIQDVRKSDGATILPHSEPRHGTHILGRKPSTVQEESDEDGETSEHEVGQESPAHQDVSHALDAVPVKSSAPSKQPSLSSESTAVESPVTVSFQWQTTPPEQRQHDGVRVGRAHSSSPARSARFALGTDHLVVRHEPPLRSVSPRKSALKHSTSPSRGASPSDESSEASGPSRFGSEATAVEAPMARKKSVRVSFNDEKNIVVGESVAQSEPDSSVPPSPQHSKRHWYSHLGRNRKRDVVSLDDDEIMKPRPALPSFGSVRDRKPQEPEERPLVRPLELTGPPVANKSANQEDEQSSVATETNEDTDGSILSQEQTARNVANISRFREPLPPVVTSVEGSGYSSASSLSSDDEDESEHETVQEPEPTPPSGPDTQATQALRPDPVVEDTPVPATAAAPAQEEKVEKTRADEEVPCISVTQPTPTPKEAAVHNSVPSPGPGYFDIPGGFPDDENESHTSAQSGQPKVIGGQPQQKAAPASERTISFAPSAQITTYEPLAEDSESEGESIYSDAYEDLSEAYGDGFMSLDAVLTTQIFEKDSKQLYQKAISSPPRDSPEHPTGSAARPVVHASSKQEKPSVDASPKQYQPEAHNTFPNEAEWEKVKLFWRELINEKRRQLEKNALGEAGAEREFKEIVQPMKAQRKKSVRRIDPAAQQQVSPNPERVYQIQPGTGPIFEEEEMSSTRPQFFRDRRPQEAAPRHVKLQKHMRQTQPQSAAGFDARKGMRANPSAAYAAHEYQQQQPDGMRRSMRQNSSSSQVALNPPGQTSMAPRIRPSSLMAPLPPLPPSARGAEDARSRHRSLDASMTSIELAKAINVQHTLRRRASDSSESSFKRSRPRREGLGGFRKSMRPNAVPDSSVASRNSRFSLRSASPPGSPPPATVGGRMTMRTLRSESSDGSTRRMRLPSFGKPSAKATAGKAGSKSRFGDSSDEDDNGQRSFRSRFDDSSDEEGGTAAALQALNGVPKGMRTSTSAAAAAAMKMPSPRHDEKGVEYLDVSHGNDEKLPTAVAQQRFQSSGMMSGADGRSAKYQRESIHSLQRSGSGLGPIVEYSATPAMGTQLMSRPHEQQQQQQQQQQQRNSLISVLRRKNDLNMGEGMGSNDSPSPSRPGGSSAKTGPKLSRKPVVAFPGSQGQPSDNWPLVGKAMDEEKRAMSVDFSRSGEGGGGGGGASRPEYGQHRRSTTLSMTASHLDDPDSLFHLDSFGKKKKKFGAFRRLFKLDE